MTSLLKIEGDFSKEMKVSKIMLSEFVELSKATDNTDVNILMQK